MPISTSSFDDGRDSRYQEYGDQATYEQETIEYPDLSVQSVKTLLQRLGGGVAESGESIEGIGWKASITGLDSGVQITFDAHDELLDDLIRRFEDLADAV